ncbi:rod shape-determining protein MreC [Streptococcus cameli]
MKRYKFSRLIISFAVLLVLSFSLLFLSSNSSLVNFSGVSSLLKESTSFLNPLFAKPVSFLSSKKDSIAELLVAFDENKQLKKTITQLESVISENDSLKSENASLRNDLSLKELYSEKQFIPALVFSRTPNAWDQEVILDIGSTNLIVPNMLVVSNGGLIGLVDSVTAHTTTVKLLTNSNNFTKLAVKLSIEDETIYGILSGYDNDSHSLIVTQLNSEKKIPDGTLIVTSDLAGDIPSNIPIGKVVSIRTNSSSLNRELFIEPLADFSNIYSVTVVGEE